MIFSKILIQEQLTIAKSKILEQVILNMLSKKNRTIKNKKLIKSAIEATFIKSNKTMKLQSAISRCLMKMESTPIQLIAHEIKQYSKEM